MQFLSSFHFSHFVHASDLSISENLFLHRFFFLCTNLFSSRFNKSVLCVLYFQSLSMQLLRDSTWCSCFVSSDLARLSKRSLLPSRRDLPRFDGSLFSKKELLNWFSGSSLLNENIAARFTCAIGIRDDSQSSRLCIYSGEASIFRSSPSSRSESAMLSAESSSECICDWR